MWSLALSAIMRIRPRTWLTVMFLAAVAAAMWYAHHSGKIGERSRQEAKQAKAELAMREEIARLDRQNAAAEATALAQSQASEARHAQRDRDALAAKDRDIADLQRGAVRLRHDLQVALSQAAAGKPAADPFRPDDAEGLRGGLAPDLAGAFAGTFYVGAKANADLKQAQEFIAVQQEFMRKVCPVQ